MLLGLDLGTTNVKALLVEAGGAIAARGSAPVPLVHTSDGGVEQDIERIWQATLEAVRQAAGGARPGEVRAVGVSSQGAAMQIRAEDGRCLGPVISWMDPRGQPFDKELTQRMGRAYFASRLGHGRSGISLGQLLWLRRQRPELLAWPNRVGFVGDTIVQRLCGRAAHDGSSLSICCLYNPSLRQADPDVLELMGLRAEQLPDLLPARQPAGPLSAEAAALTGLPAGIPVGPAVHDQYAAALGCGAIDAGDVMFGAGTAWALLAVADRLMGPVVPSAWVCDHVLPGRWGQMLSLVVGGSAFRWALAMTALEGESPEAIDKVIDSIPPGSDGLRLWPFLSGTGGEGRPTSGSVHGLRLAHGRAHLLRATVEGLCMELARQIGWLEVAGCPARRLIMCGGGARSRCTPQIVADVAGRPVTLPAEPEISAFGAAILARAMQEQETSLEELHRSMAGETRRIEPGPAAASYAKMLGEYVAALAER